jgi:hypothetical protein
MKRYFYLIIAVVLGLVLSSCEKVDKDATLTGRVGYAIAYIDTVHQETTFVFQNAAGARVYLMGDDASPNPYTGPVLETTTDSTGTYQFVVNAVTEPSTSFIPTNNFGIKIQVFYFDNIIGPAYGELSGYHFTPGKDATLPMIYLKRQTQ